jgi:hypothetical protein
MNKYCINSYLIGLNLFLLLFIFKFILILNSLLSKNTLVNKSYFSMEFFKGSLVAFGGCEMNKKCFSAINQINLGNPCPDNCSGKGKCENKIGCVCNPNFILNDCSNKAICEENCNNNGICGSNLKCDCYPGWGTKTCSNIINCAKNCTSIESGICQADSSCKCNKGFRGKDCSINDNIKNIDPIAQLISKNNKANSKQAENMRKNLGIEVKSKKFECKNNCTSTNQGICNTLLKKCECNVIINFFILLYYIFIIFYNIF